MIRIARTKPRPGGDEEPWQYGRGYQLADPALGGEWHHAKNAIYVQTLKEAADGIQHRRLAIRMGRGWLYLAIATLRVSDGELG